MPTSTKFSLNGYDWKKALHTLIMLVGATVLYFVESQVAGLKVSGAIFGIDYSQIQLGLNYLLIYIGKRYFSSYQPTV